MFEFFIDRASEMRHDYALEKPCKEAFRDEGTEDWKVRFETLEDLMAFVSREGSIVLGEDNGRHTITIYDWYLE